MGGKVGCKKFEDNEGGTLYLVFGVTFPLSAEAVQIKSNLIVSVACIARLQSSVD